MKPFIKRTNKEQKDFENIPPAVVEAKKAKIIGRIALVGLFCSFCVVVLVIYWAVAPYNVLEIKNQPVPVRPTLIDKDQYILLHFNYCKYMEVEGTVESQMMSKNAVLPLPTYQDTGHKTCNAFDAPVPIPAQAPPDTYHYHYKVTYRVNPIRTIIVEFNSQEFTLLGPEIKKEIKIK